MSPITFEREGTPPLLQRVLNKLEDVSHQGGNQYKARCPAHDDDHASLSVSWGEKGKVIFNCHANCTYNDVAAALGLGKRDLEQPRTIEATYDYQDEDGVLVYQVVRYEPKSFTQRRPDPDHKGKWLNNMQGVDPLPFNLPALAEVVEHGDEESQVWIVEGEKDCLAIDTAWGNEVVTTCNHGGAGKWTDDHSAWLEGFKGSIVIVADNDDKPTKPGQKHALAVHESILRVTGLSAEIVYSPFGKDAADAVGSHSPDDFIARTPEQLREEIADAAAENPNAEDERSAKVEMIAAEIEDREAARALVAQRRAEAQAARDKRIRVMTGDTFALDIPTEVPTLIGRGDQVLAMQDEATLFVGGDGVGKSSLVQLVVLARIGLRPDFLGYPTVPAEGRVLYLAMDRPGQIRRSFARMVSEADRATLSERLVFWQGPLPIDPLGSPQNLADWIRDEFGGDVSDVVADSYKDLAPGLAEDKPGAQLNLAMQEVLARGMQWFGIHHQRKPAADRSHDYNLADVYGSRWLTAGAGSVFMVLGEAGDSTVELRHVKQPLSVVGPLLIQHDHQRGSSQRAVERVSVAGALMELQDQRLTVREIAERVYGTYDERSRKRIERELKRLSQDPENGLFSEAGKKGGATGTTPTVWWFTPPEPRKKLRLTTEGTAE
ncbi:AAA family ATPase [Microbacterium enclense]|uniref:AAA family ATPase n=1 Tax=Microbacterium enclense TaxID=993073 RepID=UPI003F80F3B8